MACEVNAVQSDKSSSRNCGQRLAIFFKTAKRRIEKGK